MAEIQQNQQIQEVKQTSQDVAKKSLITANLIKAGIFAVITAAIVVGNFFLESKLAQGEEVTKDEVLVFNYKKDNVIPNNAVVRFDDGDLSLPPKAEVKFADNPNYIIEFESGHLWGNFLASNTKVNVLVENVVIIPDHAVFDLYFDGEKLTVATYNGDVYLGFLTPGGSEVKEYLDPYNGMFMNRLLLPRDTQAIISLKKVTEEIKPLLYSKLVKEFQYTAIPTTVRETDWIKGNLENDEKFLEAIKQQFISDTISKGAIVSDNVFSNFIFWAEENVTFVPEKKREIIFEHLFGYLNDAIFYANDNDEEKMQEDLDDFVDYLNSIPDEFLEDGYYNEKFDEYIDELIIFGPADREYKILKFLLDRKFNEKRDVYGVVGLFWNDVYKGLDSNEVLAEESLNFYYEYFDQLLGDDSDPVFYKMYIAYQNQLFDNLLLRYALFYKDGYFAIKNVLEQTLLDLYSTGQLKEELKQAFVSHKIDFLKRLRKFFFDGEIEVLEAKEIFSRLFEEIDKLMPADGSGLAVIELFESQLNDIDDFWGYLNSPEYHANVYGSTHEERYQNYLTERDKIWSFINIREDVLGEEGEEQDIVDVVNEIETIFYETEGVSNLEVGAIESVDQRYVEVWATIGGYPFRATYDRDTDSLKDVYVYDELISDRAVKLGSLLGLLQEKFSELAGDIDAEGEEVTIETTAQRYARIYIADKVSEAGFIAEMENISVVNEVDTIYRVEEVGLEGYEDIVVTFDINMNGEIVTNVFIVIGGKPTVLEGEYSLEGLAELIVAQKEAEEEEMEKSAEGVEGAEGTEGGFTPDESENGSDETSISRETESVEEKEPDAFDPVLR